jgi:exopolyphosphatase/guanosine-5'-triphosphate,3'-diphosphate pyrophosphatase
MASNADDVLERIYRNTGVMFTIIDAKKEADLTLRAVRYRLSQLSIAPSSFILTDIGGGSTELIHYSENKATSVSLNMGIVTLSESAVSETLLHEKITHFKTLVSEIVQEPKPQYFILTAGTPTTIAAYLNGMDYETYDPAKINGYRLRLEDCYRAYDDLLLMNESDRTRYVGVGRENLIIAGILMVTSIYEALGYSEAIVIDDGLREGIALEYCNQP